VTSVASSAAKDAKEKDPKEVSVVFNNQTIEIPNGEHTGAEIKAEPNFPLAVKHGNRFENLGDADVVKVRANMEFTAVAGDDNS
jgi:hypothetical protein